jgi:hypothetical protein
LREVALLLYQAVQLILQLHDLKLLYLAAHLRPTKEIFASV